MRTNACVADGCRQGLLGLVWLVCVGCGGPAVAPPKAVPNDTADLVVADGENPEFDGLPDAANGFVLPSDEQDEGVELLAGSVSSTKPNYQLPSLATCRIEQGGAVTTGSIIHSSPRHGTHILSCRHGRDKGGPWVARLSSGALLRGTKYVLSKNSDLCLLIAYGQYDLGYVRPVPVRTEVLTASEPCLSIGYDNPLGGGRFAHEAGQAPRTWTEAEPQVWRGSADGYQLISVLTPSGPGRSGGGLFIVRTSELVGICSFRDGSGVHFVGRKSVLSFLNRCGSLGHLAWWAPIEVPPPFTATPKKG